MSNTYINKIKINLANVNKTWEEFVNAKYRGGDTEEHYRYWTETCGNKQLPPHADHCICGHAIERNQYIEFEDSTIYVLGSCCIKKYVAKSKRTCDKCGAAHRTRNVNLCKDCKPIVARSHFKKIKQVAVCRFIPEEKESVKEPACRIIPEIKKHEPVDIDALCAEFGVKLWYCNTHKIHIEVGYQCMDCFLH